MRVAIAATLVAGVLAVPYVKREDMVTDVDVVYDTVIVTVTAGYPAPPPAYTASSHHHGHKHWRPHSSPAQTTAAPVAPSTYVAPSHSTAVAPVDTSCTEEESTPTSYAAPASPTSSPYTAPSSASGAQPTSYQEICVAHHNFHRANHSAPDIEWDSGLASTAAAIAASCVYAHNTDENGGGYGQNIAAGVEANNISAIITDLFYNGEVGWYDGLYGQAQPSMANFENWGHFSQIVWKATTKVGCATQYCPGGLANVGGDVEPYFTVCNYESPGNFANEYGANIGEPLGQPTIQWNYGIST